MSERKSRILGMRVPLEEYEDLRRQAAAKRQTVGGLALDLMRNGQSGRTPSIEQFSRSLSFRRSGKARDSEHN